MKKLTLIHIILFVLILLGFGRLEAGAQPPALIHYQGRLTTSAGQPIVTQQTGYFSLWRGGTATTANSGTLLYRERATVKPLGSGVFEHQVGSGTVESGSLDAASFETGEAIYLQVAIGSSGNVLLPRTRITSVGYAFVAGRAVYAAEAGLPRVTKVTDTTGGSVVVGDLLQIDGSGLDKARVTIGGRDAPLKSQSASRIVAQVPAGLPMGLQPVTVVDYGNGLDARVVATVEIHRLLVWVSPGSNPQIYIFDALTREKVAELRPGVTFGTFDNTVRRLQMAFANEGSLALVPSNVNGLVVAIDMTANPPKLIGSGAFGFNVSRAVAVAVSPDNQLAVVSDFTGDRLRIVQLSERFPPYSTAFFGDTSRLVPRPTGLDGPRGLAFVGNSMLMVCSADSGELIAIRRDPGTMNFYIYEPRDRTLATLRTRISAGVTPFLVEPSRDLTRIFVMNRGAQNLLQYYVAPQGFSTLVGSQPAGGQAWGAAVGPLGDFLYVADANADLLREFNTNEGLTIVGDDEGPLDSPIDLDFQLAAIEPITGQQLAIGTNNSRLLFYQREGGTLYNLSTFVLPSSGRQTYELRYQP